jgi:hypothetical protein
VIYDDAIASNVYRVHVYDNRFSSDGSGSEDEEKMRIIDFFCFCSFFVSVIVIVCKVLLK